MRAMRLATSISRWVQVGDLNMTVSETMAAAISPAILAVGIRPLSWYMPRHDGGGAAHGLVPDSRWDSWSGCPPAGGGR